MKLIVSIISIKHIFQGLVRYYIGILKYINILIVL